MLTAQIESLTDRLQELKPILPMHYEELALNKDKVPLDPQYDVYLEKDARGEIVFATVRDSGELIGYFVGFVAPHLHYQTCLTCTMDILYVKQDARGQSAGLMLFDTLKEELRRRGVQRWFVGSKLHKHIGMFFQRLEFEPVEMYFSKWLGD